jgi:glycosyltransferase involved in cell wall biosynthesis
LESLALGTPVVSTSKGAEGLDLVPGRDLLIADRPADFAAATVRLLKDEALRESLSQSGRQAVEERYDWEIIGQQFNNFVEAVVSETK